MAIEPDVVFLVVELRDQLDEFAAEHHVENPTEAVKLLLQEYRRLMDLAWDEAFARTPEHPTALDDLIAEVQADAAAGNTEELTDDMFDR